MKKTIKVFLILISLTTSTAAQIINGNFEQGSNSGWIAWSSGGYQLIGKAENFSSSEINPPVYPKSGEYMARLGGYGYDENYIKQTITLPNTSKVYLGCYYQERASTTSECYGLWVGSRIRFIVDGEILLEYYLCDYNAIDEWSYVYFDLSTAAGKTVEMGFRADAANSVWSFLYLDDIQISTTTGIEENKDFPLEYELSQNYPNPFNPISNFEFQIADLGHVEIKVYDIIGREVAVLMDEEKPAGEYTLKFDASGLSSGVYYYQLKVNGHIFTRKMLLAK